MQIMDLYDSGAWMGVSLLSRKPNEDVYEIANKEDGRKAALKVVFRPYPLVGDEDPEIEAIKQGIEYDMSRQIRIMDELNGEPCIVHCHHHAILSSDKGLLAFFRMELLKCIEDDHLDFDEILELGLGVCEALEKFEAKRIIHRDIKPSNLFRDNSGRYKVGNFGTAHKFESSESDLMVRDAFIVGTPAFMAPEILERRPYDATVDLFSLGKTLLEISSKSESVPYRLKRILEKACAKNREERYQSAKEFHRELLLYKEMKNASISAPVPPPQSSRFEKSSHFEKSSPFEESSHFEKSTPIEESSRFEKSLPFWESISNLIKAPISRRLKSQKPIDACGAKEDAPENRALAGGQPNDSIPPVCSKAQEVNQDKRVDEASYSEKAHREDGKAKHEPQPIMARKLTASERFPADKQPIEAKTVAFKMESLKKRYMTINERDCCRFDNYIDNKKLQGDFVVTRQFSSLSDLVEDNFINM